HIHHNFPTFSLFRAIGSICILHSFNAFFAFLFSTFYSLPRLVACNINVPSHRIGDPYVLSVRPHLLLPTRMPPALCAASSHFVSRSSPLFPHYPMPFPLVIASKLNPSFCITFDTG